MKTAIFFATTVALALVLGMVMMNSSQNSQQTISSSINKSELTQIYKAQECTDQRATVCAVFIASTIQACVTAMEAAGVDVIADIRCARARKLITNKKDCIPCLCEEIKKRGWKWLQCPAVY